MKIRLGYVAISLTLNELNHYQTITWTRFCQLGKSEGEKKLSQIIEHNLEFLEYLLNYNIENEIYFYRMSHNMIPLATHPKYTYNYISPYQKKWQQIGEKIKSNQLRVDVHPDQYCVLNSTNDSVYEGTVRELKFCQKIYKALGISGKVILHVGSSLPDKEEALNRFRLNFSKLPLALKKMIILENDDKIYTAQDVLELCEELEVPMVLDYHHYICNHKKERLEQLLPRIFSTWKKENLPPKIHFSSPKSMKEKRAHSTYLSYTGFEKFLKIIAPFEQDVDIMLECKGKDEALFRLVRQLKASKQYEFINNSTFFIPKNF